MTLSADTARRLETTLLIVDDDDIDVMSIQRSLRTLGLAYPTVVARDGIEALELLRGDNGRRRVEPPFIILLDLNMPRMDGLEFLDELRRDHELADSVVFVLTTSSAERDRRAAWRHHVAGFIPKGMADQSIGVLQMIDRYCSVVHLPAAR